LQTRYTPLVSFVLDEGVKKSIEMTRLINEALGPKNEDQQQGTDEQPTDGTAAEGPAGP